MLNERLRDLEEQSGLAVYGLGLNQEKWEARLTTFSELIIRECIERITTYDLVPGHSAKWEDIYDIHARLLQDLGEDLKEHFGVEE